MKKLKEIKMEKIAKYSLIGVLGLSILSIGVIGFSNNDSDINNYVDVPVNKDNEIVNDNPVEVIKEETLLVPYKDNVTIRTYYFDASKGSANNENALIYYNGMYTPSYGIDYTSNNISFPIYSSFKGKVIDKRIDPLYGASLYIKSDNNDLVAIYSSLSNINVDVDDIVNQGDIIARAGNNSINSSLGNHLNYSLKYKDNYINPLDYYNKEIKSINK